MFEILVDVRERHHLLGDYLIGLVLVHHLLEVRVLGFDGQSDVIEIAEDGHRRLDVHEALDEENRLFLVGCRDEVHDGSNFLPEIVARQVCPIRLHPHAQAHEVLGLESIEELIGQLRVGDLLFHDDRPIRELLQ